MYASQYPSSFQSPPPPPPARWRQAFPVSLEAAGFGVPLSVGAAALLFSRIGGDFLAMGLLAALVGIVLLHVVSARNRRPMVYSVRIMEVSMMLGFLEQFTLKMPGWGLADTPAHRLMLVVAVGIGAALMLPLGHALRLQRFARLIPTPVFAGFGTAIAVTLLISQVGTLWRSWPVDGAWFIAVALVVALGATAAERWLRSAPPGLAGVVLGVLVAALVGAAGVHALGHVQQGGLVLTLPALAVPWSDAWAPQVDTVGLVRDVLLASATLALLIFLNTVVSEEFVTQLDDQRAGPRDWLRTTLGQLAAACLGAPPVTAAIGPTRAAVRVGRLERRAMLGIAAFALAVLASGVLNLVPLAAISGLLLYDGWKSFDRPSTALAWRSLRGGRLVHSEKEDLVTIGLVVSAAVLFNMVVGVFVGVFAGLVLYAWRNGRRLARTVASGTAVRSNCARSTRDTQRLAERAERIRFVALEGALFFGAAGALQVLLREQAASGHYVVVDWSHVVSADSTVASAFVRAAADAKAAGAEVAASGLEAAGTRVADTLAAAGMQVPTFPDADRALEWAENEVLRDATRAAVTDGTTLQDALALLQGLDGAQREALEALFEQRFFRAGDTVFRVGETNRELMLLMQGSVDILVPHGEGGPGRNVRLARIRRGAMLGELSFLDGSARAASAVATEDLLVGVLDRERFDAFARAHPEAGRRVLSNLALDLAFRLRRTNQLAVGNLR